MDNQKRETKSDKAGSGSLNRRKQSFKVITADAAVIWEILHIQPDELSETIEISEESGCDKKDEDVAKISSY